MSSFSILTKMVVIFFISAMTLTKCQLKKPSLCEENSTVNVQGWHEEIDVAHGNGTFNIQYSQILQQQTMIFSEFYIHLHACRSTRKKPTTYTLFTWGLDSSSICWKSNPQPYRMKVEWFHHFVIENQWEKHWKDFRTFREFLVFATKARFPLHYFAAASEKLWPRNYIFAFLRR